MKYRVCPNCNTPQPSEGRFCRSCGADLIGYRPLPRWQRSAWFKLTVEAAAVASAALAIARPDTDGPVFVLFAVAWGLAIWGTQCGPPHAAGASLQDRRRSRALRTLGILVLAFVFLAPIAMLTHAIVAITRARAGRTQSLSNLRKLGQAMLHYAEDNDGRLPGWVRGSDGRLYHNVWDQQIAPYVGDATAYVGPYHPRGIRSPSQPGVRSRILSYGLNGLLITKPKRVFDGNADWSAGPRPAALSAIPIRAGTIMLAELATERSMGDPYVCPPVPPGVVVTGETRRYRHALNQWIDIDPRDWVETRGPVDSYGPSSWDPQRGVARDFWDTGEVFGCCDGGGGCVVFTDGHAQSLHTAETTGMFYGVRSAKPVSAFRPANWENMWRPEWDRPRSPAQRPKR